MRCASSVPGSAWRVTPKGVAFDPHPDMLRQVTTMTMITEQGPVDLCFTPAGFPDGFAGLREHALTIVVGAVDLPVASLEDVVISKVPQDDPRTSSPSHHSKHTYDAPTDRRGHQISLASTDEAETP